MAKKEKTLDIVLYAVALAMGVVTIILSWTGLPGNYEAGPLLGIGMACLGLAGLKK